MSQSSIIYPENATSSPGFDRFDAIPTVKTLKDRYLFGVDLRDTNGNTLKRSVIAFHIKEAISQIEHELEITISPTQYTETQDYRAEEYEAWCLLQLKRKPVITVDTLQYRLEKDNSFMTIPDSWIRLENHPGQIQIAPTSGGLSSINFGQNSFLPRLVVFNPDWPAFFRITYTAGFEANKVPAVISGLIGMIAAIKVLIVAGELILGAGINSESLSIDGLAQSLGSAISGTDSAYGPRLKMYGESIKHSMIVLKKYYGKGLKCVIV